MAGWINFKKTRATKDPPVKGSQHRMINHKPSIISKIYAVGCLLLLALGIVLYLMREQKMPAPVGHNATVNAKGSTQRIIADEFLILISERNINKIDEILSPLALTLEMPLLNWLLVKKIHHDGPKIIPLASEGALESTQLLTSLAKHPFVLDAQHNYVLDSAGLFAREPRGQGLESKESYSSFKALADSPGAKKILPVSKSMTIGIVDQFFTQGIFTFAKRFGSCLDRVELSLPNFGEAKRLDQGPVPHGEIMLLTLGACNEQKVVAFGMNFQGNLLAIERPTLGHAQTFAAALFASHIDLCKKSILPCPTTISFKMPKNKPDILLLPFGGDAPELLQFTSDMIAALRTNNTIIVTAAGNDQTNAQNFFPGGSPEVINVGALNNEGERASFSNWGPPIDILAPGADIEFQYPNGLKRFFGTSIAAGFVALTLGLMKTVVPSLSQSALELLLTRGARPLTCEDYCPKHELNKFCPAICCQTSRNICGKLALNSGHAIKLASEKPDLPLLLSLSSHYLLFLRDENSKKDLYVSNIGAAGGKVIAKPSDENVLVVPEEFALSKNGMIDSMKTLSVSLRKEPFKRKTYKVTLEARDNDNIIDHADFYIEYIPKK